MLEAKRDAASSARQDPDSSSEWNYEVFLSFRGPDTRKNFTDHLNNALVSRGIRTFIDNEELRIGEEIGPALRFAIQESKIAIPIFSKGYAWSKWCLRELANIMECMKQKGQRHLTVMPIFYHVHPSIVQNQTGCYEEAFRNHEKKFDKETVEGWKKALKEVGELKGWDLEEIADGHESKLIQLIVKEVWSVLRKSPLIVSDNLVGIYSRVEEVMKLLNIESNDTRIVGIHGLGGIGKTTIARCVYKTIYHHFDGCCFIADARETFRTRGLVPLQSQLIINILNMENPNITSVDQGIHMIKERLSNKKVLIVIDDVDQNIYLNALIGNRGWFGYGSKIIITTRDKHILDVHGVDGTYKPKEMDLDHSLELFSKHAFKMDGPPEHYLALSIDVVKTTGGLPLALEVIGSSLYGGGEFLWKSMVKKLKKIPHGEVQKKLKISYDELEYEVQQIFLDIACFFIGMDKNIACYIWDGCNFYPDVGIDVLNGKSLVKIGEKNELMMHDQLRDLGREIVRQENPKELGERSRLWLHQEVLDVLHSQQGTRKVESLCIKFPRRDPQRLMNEGFGAMTNLRLLQLDHAVVFGNFMHSFSELRWLSLRGCRIIPFRPTNPRKLVVLDLSWSDVTESWTGWSYIKVAETLKVLDLTGSDNLSQTPDLSANLKLEELILQDCINLVTIDNSIGHLKKLVLLNMKECKNLKNLPTSICELTSLRRLDVRFTKISQLPEKLGCLEALTELLIDLTWISRLPNSIGDLRNLKTLSANNCKIKEGGIPDVIGRLSSLEVLTLSRNQFHTLPATISNLPLLRTLDLNRCDKLQSLPLLSNLTNLENLDLDWCTNLTELSISMIAFARLKSLSLVGCTALRCISHLPTGLTYLYVLHCENVREMSAFWDMKNLKTLELIDWPRLEKIEGLEGLVSLEKFEIHDCDSLSKLLNLRGLKKLRYLKFINVGLAEIEGLDGLYSLKILSIGKCGPLRKIPNLSGLDSLEELVLDGCPSLRHLQLPKKLKKVQLSNCDELSEIEGLECLESLEVFTICDSPLASPYISTLKNLKYLEIFRWDCVERLPDLSNLNKLKSLQIHTCGKLIDLSAGVDGLKSLEMLQVESCHSLEIIPDLSNLTKLRILFIYNCWNLVEIQGVDGLEMLEELYIVSCNSIETLPSLSNLKKLRIVSTAFCRKLTQIRGVDELESLEKLDVYGCNSMNRTKEQK